jgi:hypothetical protein
MADIVVTEAAVAVIFPLKAEIHTVILEAAASAGEVIYFTATGGGAIADANDAGLQQARGLCLTSGGIGQAVNILKKGHCAGFTLATQTPDDQVFLTDTAGAVGDAAGTMTVPIGRVVILSDKALTKCIFFEFDWNVQWS